MTTKVRRRRKTPADPKSTDGQIRELTPEEGWELFDERARRYLGIDGCEFIRRWDAGEYRDNADRREVLSVAAALSFGRAEARRRC
jgi:hypothetical protein